MLVRRSLPTVIRFLLLIVACGALARVAGQSASAEGAPLGLPATPTPDDNPSSPEKIALGQQLYFDPRLSRDSTVSCATCHDPSKGYSNGSRFATGVGGQVGGRSAPTVINTAHQKLQFWDGRAGSLEEQALGPIQNPIEMNMTLPEVVARLSEIAGYREQFQKVFGTEITADGIGKAIAAYERTVLSANAPFDRFKAGEEGALTPEARRGHDLFFGKANCSACHTGANFTDNGFHNIGVGMDKPEPDVGREAISGLEGDRGAFKTPTLREIARTAPYMHDGSLATLEDVVEHYSRGGIPNRWLDEELFPITLSAAEKHDLIEFLKTGLSSPDYPQHEAPELPR